MLNWLRRHLGRHVADDAPLGPRGENAAARYLRSKGYRILARNFRLNAGEIDIIARDGPTLVFVEVKTRADNRVAPEEQVDWHKQKQIMQVARVFLSRYGVPRPPARFDVVAVIWPPGCRPQIRHTTSAFQAVD
ncbi:MAG: YraN family protein [Phycisphaerae bacterium]|nr:YraN family protein [Phycisphaerae bacterium]MDW8262909.1 YraN family protein [Phycisphaerales bacterium]